MNGNDEIAPNLDTNVDNYAGLTHSHHPKGMLAHTSKQCLPSSWILLDSCSAVDLITDQSLLEDIHEVEEPIPIHCNAGTVRAHKQGYLGSYPRPVQYHPDGTTNIMSLFNVSQHYHATMDSNISNSITLPQTDEKDIIFTPSDKELYKYAMRPGETAKTFWTLTLMVAAQADKYTRC